MTGEFGTYLRQVRKRAGLQQRDLAAQMGIQPSRISRIEKGRVTPNREEIMSLLRAIGSEDSMAVAQEAEQPLVHILAPTWLELPLEDQTAIREADRGLQLLEEFRSRSSFRSIMENHVSYLRQRLRNAASYLINTDHT